MNWKEIMLGIILAMFFVLPCCFIMASQGSLVINRPYLNEYNQCKAQVSELQKSIQCPKVVCNPGSTGIIWSVVGGIIYVLALWFSFSKQKELNQKEKELEERYNMKIKNLNECLISAKVDKKMSKR